MKSKLKPISVSGCFFRELNTTFQNLLRFFVKLCHRTVRLLFVLNASGVLNLANSNIKPLKLIYMEFQRKITVESLHLIGQRPKAR